MIRRSKKYKNSIKNVDKTKKYSFEDAIKLSIASAYAKFDETVDLALVLGIDAKKSDQVVRGAVALPYGIGKKVKIIAFAKGDKKKEALDAGADLVGDEDLVQKIQGGWLEFDKVLASPDMMGLVGKVAKILGPKGLMPNAKVGTITTEIGKAVGELKAGKVEFKADKAGLIHVPVGKVSFGPEKLIENAKVVISRIKKLKPPSSKGKYLCKLAVSTTMGPGIKVDEEFLNEF